MQPLDRVNAHFRRSAAAMRTATLQQRLENGEQRSRMRMLREENQVLRRRSWPEGVTDVSLDDATAVKPRRGRSGSNFVSERRS